MKLYLLLCGVGATLTMIGTGAICGAIEWRTSLVLPLLITAAGMGLFYAGYKESGGYF